MSRRLKPVVARRLQRNFLDVGEPAHQIILEERLLGVLGRSVLLYSLIFRLTSASVFPEIHLCFILPSLPLPMLIRPIHVPFFPLVNCARSLLTSLHCNTSKSKID